MDLILARETKPVEPLNSYKRVSANNTCSEEEMRDPQANTDHIYVCNNIAMHASFLRPQTCAQSKTSLACIPCRSNRIITGLHMFKHMLPWIPYLE